MEPLIETRRRYRRDTLVLETDFRTQHAQVQLIDFMPPRTRTPDLVRIVRGVQGQCRLKLSLDARMDYGALKPWTEPGADHVNLIAGPEALRAHWGDRGGGHDFAP